MDANLPSQITTTVTSAPQWIWVLAFAVLLVIFILIVLVKFNKLKSPSYSGQAVGVAVSVRIILVSLMLSLAISGLVGAIFLNQIESMVITGAAGTSVKLECPLHIDCQAMTLEAGILKPVIAKSGSDPISEWKHASQFGGFAVRLGDGTVGLFKATNNPKLPKSIYYFFVSIQQVGVLSLILWVVFSGILYAIWRARSGGLGVASESLPEDHTSVGNYIANTESRMQANVATLVGTTPAKLLTRYPGLFSSLDGLGAASIRLLPIYPKGSKEIGGVASSIGQADPFARLDPIVLAIAAKLDSIDLVDTRKLFKKNDLIGVNLPESILIRVLKVGDKPLAVLWVAFEKRKIYSPEVLNLVEEFVTSLSAGIPLPGNQPAITADANRQAIGMLPALDAITDPILVIDPNGKIELANTAATDLFHLRASGSPKMDLANASMPPQLRSLFGTPATNPTTNEIQLDNGSFYLAQSFPLVGGQCVWVLRDINLSREQERLRSEFLNAVSHDLRGPLSRIRGYNGMIEMVGSLNDQQMVYAQKINEGIDDMTRLVNSLLDLGRIDAGIRLQLELTSVVDLANRAANSVQGMAAQKKLDFTKEFVGGDALIQVDPALIGQAITNLLENAIKYSDTPGRVHLRVFRQGAEHYFEVSDNGLGISNADKPHLFEKFYRSQQPQVKARKGSGLGLAIVKSIVTSHNGKIWFESKEGKGTTFTICIPIRQN